MSTVNIKTEVGIENINLDTIDMKEYEKILARISVDTGLPNNDDPVTGTYFADIQGMCNLLKR